MGCVLGRFAAIAALVALLLLTCCGASAAGATQGGPRFSFVEWRYSSQELEKARVETFLVSARPNGSGRHRLFGKGRRINPTIFHGGSWSPDGSRVAFSGTPIAGGREGKPRIYILRAGRGRPRALPKTLGGTHPVFSPDGSRIAFKRSRFRFHFNRKNPLKSRSYASATSWMLDLASGKARQLTPWRNGLFNSPYSFSPGGTVLALDRSRPGRGTEAVSYDLGSRKTTTIAVEATEPVFSPDGSRVALVSYRDHLTVDGFDGPEARGEIYTVAPDGSDPVRVTHAPRAYESEPSWDPSGSRLAYTSNNDELSAFLGLENSVMAINVDGTCPTTVISRRRSRRGGSAYYGPAWQPGPGREAGPISC